MKSLQDCKEAVANKYAYKDWNSIPYGTKKYGNLYDEAFELYCGQYKKAYLISDQEICRSAKKQSPRNIESFIKGAMWMKKRIIELYPEK